MHCVCFLINRAKGVLKEESQGRGGTLRHTCAAVIIALRKHAISTRELLPLTSRERRRGGALFRPFSDPCLSRLRREGGCGNTVHRCYKQASVNTSVAARCPSSGRALATSCPRPPSSAESASPWLPSPAPESRTAKDNGDPLSERTARRGEEDERKRICKAGHFCRVPGEQSFLNRQPPTLSLERAYQNYFFVIFDYSLCHWRYDIYFFNLIGASIFFISQWRFDIFFKTH